MYLVGLIWCIFLLVASLIHNEIIIINRCNLSKYTEFKISMENEKKVEEDIKYIQSIRNNNNIYNNENEINQNENLLPNDSLGNSVDD